MSETPTGQCPDLELEQVAGLIDLDAVRGAGALARLLASYPNDARLHFLTGSMRAGEGDYSAAEVALARAVSLAPDLAVARFQLGFLRLTNGDARAAAETWRPLQDQPVDDPLRLFVEGLNAMAQDQFDVARARLNEGVQRNTLLPPLNGDMRLVLAELERLIETPDADSTSSAQWLLQQDAARRTRH